MILNHHQSDTQVQQLKFKITEKMATFAQYFCLTQCFLLQNRFMHAGQAVVGGLNANSDNLCGNMGADVGVEELLALLQYIINFNIFTMEIVEFEEQDQDDLHAPLQLMKNLTSLKPFRFIDDLNRKASDSSDTTNHSTSHHFRQSFSGQTRKQASLKGRTPPEVEPEDSEDSQVFNGKIIGGTCPLTRQTARKKITIQKKRSSAYPLNGDGFTKLGDGRVVFGTWKDGVIDGKAKIMYPSADIYVGEVKDYNRHGKGVLTLKNGLKYIGSFINGKCEGFGVKYDQNGDVCCEGIWKNGALVKRIS